MAIITFWSNTNNQTGQTMSAVAVATNMAIEHNYKILLISTQYNDDSLELCFGNQNKNKNLINKLVKNPNVGMDNGIEGLSKIANSGKLEPEIIQNYTNVVLKERLEILYGFQDREDKNFLEDYLKVKDQYKDIINDANKFYDMVIVDLKKGLTDDISKNILQISDVIVYNVEQKIVKLNDFLELKPKLLNITNKNNIILNIGRLDEQSKYSIKNISRYLKMQSDITTIPYNTLFFEASGEEKIVDLFLKIRKISQTDKNAIFIKQVQNTVENILYKIKEVQMKI